MSRLASTFCLLLLAAPLAALAHKPSDSYLHLTRDGDGHGLTGRWDVALKDLDDVLVLDAEGDGTITWAEVRARQADITGYVLGRLSLGADGASCALEPGEALRVVRHSDGAYAVLDFAARCPAMPSALDVGYTLLFDRDPQHRGILQVGARAPARRSSSPPLAARRACRWRACRRGAASGRWCPRAWCTSSPGWTTCSSSSRCCCRRCCAGRRMGAGWP
ncbi:hypothetical protein ACLESO_18940 [Pyxidicoccus sp. 3LG]